MAAAYEVARWGATSVPGSGTAIDVFGGARVWWQQADASLALSGTVNIGDLTRNANGTLTASGNVSWVDPLVGLRLRHQIVPGLNICCKWRRRRLRRWQQVLMAGACRL